MFRFIKKFVSQLKKAGFPKGSLNTLFILALIILALKETGSYIHWLRLLKVHRRIIYIMIIALKIFRCCPWWKSPSSCSLRKRWLVLLYVCVHQWNGWGLWRSSAARMDEPDPRLQGFSRNSITKVIFIFFLFVYNYLVKLFFLRVDTRPCWLQSYWIREAEWNHQEWLRVLCRTSLEKRKRKVLLESCRN